MRPVPVEPVDSVRCLGLIGPSAARVLPRYSGAGWEVAQRGDEIRVRAPEKIGTTDPVDRQPRHYLVGAAPVVDPFERERASHGGGRRHGGGADPWPPGIGRDGRRGILLEQLAGVAGGCGEAGNEIRRGKTDGRRILPRPAAQLFEGAEEVEAVAADRPTHAGAELLLFDGRAREALPVGLKAVGIERLVLPI